MELVMSERWMHAGSRRGLIRRLIERLREREQLLVRAGEDLPLLLLTYPHGAEEVAREIEAAYARTLRRLSPAAQALYQPLFASAPALVVVILNPLNPCECLGHHHPRGTESRFARRLSADLGEPIGEIDLAYEGIRNWKPEPLSSLAVGDLGGRLPAIHFQAAVLAVLLHELEHLVFPERTEHDIRLRSNSFYSAAMRELVEEESGAGYGMASPPPRP
jgi:hypothetical protein